MNEMSCGPSEVSGPYHLPDARQQERHARNTKGLFDADKVDQKTKDDEHAGKNARSMRRVYVKDPMRYKTQLCKNFSRDGVCKYAHKCQFAHGAHELEARKSPDAPQAAVVSFGPVFPITSQQVRADRSLSRPQATPTGPALPTTLPALPPWPQPPPPPPSVTAAQMSAPPTPQSSSPPSPPRPQPLPLQPLDPQPGHLSVADTQTVVHEHCGLCFGRGQRSHEQDVLPSSSVRNASESDLCINDKGLVDFAPPYFTRQTTPCTGAVLENITDILNLVLDDGAEHSIIPFAVSSQRSDPILGSARSIWGVGAAARAC